MTISRVTSPLSRTASRLRTIAMTCLLLYSPIAMRVVRAQTGTVSPAATAAPAATPTQPAAPAAKPVSRSAPAAALKAPAPAPAPATPAKPAASSSSSSTPAPPPPPAKVAPADLSSLNDLNDHLRLDNLSFQTEQEKAAQTDPVIRQAQQLIAKRMAALPDVQSLKKQSDDDFAALQAKMVALRSAAKLSNDWQVNLNTGEWVGPQPAPSDKKEGK